LARREAGTAGKKFAPAEIPGGSPKLAAR